MQSSGKDIVRRKIALLLTAVFFAAIELVAALARAPHVPVIPSRGEVKPGEWNADFSAVTNYAAVHHVPAVVVFSNPLGSCGACERFQTACNEPEFKEWQARRGLAMAFGKTPLVQNFTKPVEKAYNNGTPFVCVWWPKTDGSVLKASFSGVPNKMPSSVGKSLAAQTVNAIETFLYDFAVPGVAQARRMSLPLYSADGGVRRLAGRVDVRIAEDGRFAAKVLGGLGAAATAPCGRWFLGGAGDKVSTRAGDGASLEFSRAANGCMSVKFSDKAGDANFESGELAEPKVGAYAGLYNVAFSADAVRPFTCLGWMHLSVSPSGDAKWFGMLASGGQFFGRCRVSVDSKGNAVLPVFDPVAGVSAPLLIRRGMAARVGEGDCRAIKVVDGAVARIPNGDEVAICKAWGSCVSRELNLEEVADDAYASTTLGLSFGAMPGGGDAVAFPTGAVVVSSANLALVEKKDVASFKYIQARGMFGGAATVRHTDGTSSPVVYRGVLIPGWHDCGCNERLLKPETPFHIEHAQPHADPFAVGGAWFGRDVDGAPGRWMFSVRID